jgi:allantoicase
MDLTQLIDLASEKLGGAVLYANDDFFAPKENLIKPAEPVWIEGKYTDDGKWMDGWESRRRRSPRLDEPFDWCIVRLGMPGEVRAVVVDTAYFKGNYPSHCSIDACAVNGNIGLDRLLANDVSWTEVLPSSELLGDHKNIFETEAAGRITHLKLKIYPDGGVARLRAHGHVLPDWDDLRLRDSEIDLAAAENGGDVIAASDEFFGRRQNLIMPGRATDMSDGWETRRRRGPGYDWCVVKLGAPGRITRIEVDTAYFRGNYPESCSLEAAFGEDIDALEWTALLDEQRLQPHARHSFTREVIASATVSHVRFNIFPDGGVSRLRLYGRVE